MRFRESESQRGSVVALTLGIAAGAAVGVFFGLREWRRRRVYDRAPAGHLGRLEEATVDALRSDELAGRRAIDVAAVSDGIMELSGVVEEQDEARRAVDVAQRVEGVHTVINRLSVGTVERQLIRTRRRYQTGDPSLTEPHWYGMRVGMGRRRQSASTDPDRSDDRVEQVSRVLEPSPADAEPEGAESGTATELSSEEAGVTPAWKRSIGETH
jgi:hypothetical protein